VIDSRIEHALDRALELGEVGIQVAAFKGDECIINECAGVMTPEGASVTCESIFTIFSVTKAVSFTLLHLQAERGLIDYDAPVARYWPEYGANGKDRVLVRHLLEHRSGAPQMPPGTTVENMLDWEWMIKAIAELPLLFPPGTKSTYQAKNVGWVVGELVSRSDPKGRHIKDFLQQELCEPLGMSSFWMGIPSEAEDRVAKLSGEFTIGIPAAARPLWQLASPDELGPNPTLSNRADMRRGCLPAIGGIGSAESLARYWTMLANGGTFRGQRYLSAGRVWSFLQNRPNVDEFDSVIGGTPRQTVGGFRRSFGQYPRADAAVGDRPWVLMHNGAGGSIGWADLQLGLGVAICHNRMFDNFPPVPLEDHPFAAIGEAVYQVAAD
jgi:CubicO group peptidase (beta-lactamase class C family)